MILVAMGIVKKPGHHETFGPRGGLHSDRLFGCARLTLAKIDFHRIETLYLDRVRERGTIR